MTISYQLAPIPKWYIADLTGKPLGGGYMATYNSANKTVLQVVYQDPGGNFPWPYVNIPNTGLQGILFDENGSQGPFYWTVDTSNPQNTYYVEIYDSNGVLQWTIDDFAPPSTGGGGGNITTALSIDNLITNNIMYRNIGSSANPIGTTALKLSLGAHDGLAQTASNAGPDIWFIKTNTNATDKLTFTTFASTGLSLNGDVTPVQFLNYTCSILGAGETTKCVQFPITQNSYNLNNQAVMVTIWARCTSGSTSLTLQWFQFFGDGAGATTSVVTNIQTLVLTASWQKFTISTTIPALPSPLTIGGCGNDGLFFRVSYPFSTLTNIDFTKPSVYLGTVAPSQDYTTYDSIASVINSPRTGYIFSSYDLVAPFGYVIMNDGTIGSGSSAATTRANIDTFPLYNWLYTNVTIPSTNTICVVTGYTGNAITDFTANRVMQLPIVLGRAMASAGAGSGLTSRGLGSVVGEETHLLTIAEMPAHTHATPSFSVTNASAGFGVNAASAGSNNTGITGGGGAHNNMQPTSFMNFFIKL